MAYAVGYTSGAHFNPAVTVGCFAAGRFAGKDVVPYIVVQVIGGVVAGGVLLVVPLLGGAFGGWIHRTLLETAPDDIEGGKRPNADTPA
jgi:glycerol uptake facilitator-like aquaporin